jgi:hypothetical protein
MAGASQFPIWMQLPAGIEGKRCVYLLLPAGRRWSVIGSVVNPEYIIAQLENITLPTIAVSQRFQERNIGYVVMTITMARFWRRTTYSS